MTDGTLERTQVPVRDVTTKGEVVRSSRTGQAPRNRLELMRAERYTVAHKIPPSTPVPIPFGDLILAERLWEGSARDVAAQLGVCARTVERWRNTPPLGLIYSDAAFAGWRTRRAGGIQR